jgi:hypothetical protein
MLDGIPVPSRREELPIRTAQKKQAAQAAGAPARGWFDFDGPAGLGHATSREDAIRLEGILANSGDLDLVASDGPTGFWGTAHNRALRRYQKRHRLTVDGWLRPGGPTLALMYATMARVLEGFGVPTPDEIDRHHAAIREGAPPRIAIVPQIELTPIPGLPAISIADHAANAAQIDWMLQNWSGLGGVPAQLAHYVVRRGDVGLAQARDFVAQYSVRNPHGLDVLVYAVLRALPDSASRERFLGGTPGGYRPAATRLVR